MNDLFIRIVTEAQETEDEFIFTTIQPFCEDVAKRKISKVELVKLLSQPEIIRCKDCKHKPHTSDEYDYDNGDCGYEIIFPDYRCLCRCEDEYYNRIPDDDWYCGNAERRQDE